MKYIKRYNESNNIDIICKEYDIRNYTINSDGSIDVDNDVDLFELNLTKLPLAFNKISGYFNCCNNKLTTLEGAPKYVGEHFMCEYNSLTSLKGGPDYVHGYYDCSNNKLTSLEYAPKNTMLSFYCNDNKIINFNNFDIKIERDFDIENNTISYFYNNFIKSIDNIELFNDYRIIEGNILYLNRFKSYVNNNNYKLPDLNIIAQYYTNYGYTIK